MEPPGDTPPQLAIVTGAPGAGKSAVVAALLRAPGEVLCFDADWLLAPASALAGTSVWEASETWPAYRTLWLRIVQMLVRNGRRVALFASMDPDDLVGILPLPGVARAAWCLLDCDDATRRGRLRARGWEATEIDEALGDARVLRGRIPTVIDTSGTTPEEAAAQVRAWLDAPIR